MLIDRSCAAASIGVQHSLPTSVQRTALSQKRKNSATRPLSLGARVVPVKDLEREIENHCLLGHRRAHLAAASSMGVSRPRSTFLNLAHQHRPCGGHALAPDSQLQGSCQSSTNPPPFERRQCWYYSQSLLTITLPRPHRFSLPHSPQPPQVTHSWLFPCSSTPA